MPEQRFIENLSEEVGFEMILIEGGRFMMGGQDVDVDADEKPVHEVVLEPFFIGKYPVTQAVWKHVLGPEANRSEFQGDTRPVEMVSWLEVQEFLIKLRRKAGRHYRLLSEAEWEYAARGGQKSEGYLYAGSNKLKDVGWYGENSYGETKPVGLKYPNELGLYDMSGNVYEWVEDQWHKDYGDAPKDGAAWVDQEEGAFVLSAAAAGTLVRGAAG